MTEMATFMFHHDHHDEKGDGSEEKEKSNQHVTLSLYEYTQMLQSIHGQQPRGIPPLSGLGNPGPLGLGGFAMTTFILSVFNTGLYEYRIPNTFGATAFCSYGAFWASFATYVKFVVPNLPADQVHNSTGIFLFAWTIFTLYMLAASIRVSWALFSVFLPLELTFIFLTGGNFAQNNTVIHIGGWLGIITSAAAWYTSCAVVVNSTWGREICPVGVYKKKEAQKPLALHTA